MDERRIIVRVRGDVDADAGNWLMCPVNKAISRSRPEVLIDARDVTFLSTAALDLLVRAADTAADHGVRFVLVTDRPCVLRPVHLAGLDRQAEVRGELDVTAESVIDTG